ncbi:MAG: class I SAM-dependent methyltransferase [Coriobacteriia bacterium]
MSPHTSRSSARFAKASERWTPDDGAAIAAELGLSEADSVLDVGGGIGVLASYVAAASGCTVTVLDRDPSAVAEALSRPGVSGVLGDAASMPFPDASFDAAILIDAFHHVADQRSAVFEIARVLRSGAKVLVAERNPRYFAARLTFAYERIIGESVLAHEPEELAEMFRLAGIEGGSTMGSGDSYRFFGIRK